MDIFTYGLRLRIISRNLILDNVEIQIAHEKLQIINSSTNCILGRKDIILRRLPNGWDVSIPKNILPPAQAYFVSADTSLGSLNIDKSAWRMIELGQH